MAKFALQIDLPLFIAKLRELGLFIQDREHGVVYPNKYWYRWGYDEGEMRDQRFMEHVHPEDVGDLKAALANLENGSDADNGVLFRIKTRGGQWRWVYSTSLTVSRNADGSIRHYIGFDYDMTEQMLEKQRAEHLAQEASTLASAAAIINSHLDLKHTINAILDQARQVIPFSSASVQIMEGDHLEIAGGRGFDSLDKLMGLRFAIPGDNPNTEVVENRAPLVLNEDPDIRFPGFSRVAERRVSCWMGLPLIHRQELVGVMTFDRVDGPYFTQREMQSGQNFANHVAIALRNAQLFEEMKKISIRDPLTGIYNRRWMYEMLQREMDLSIRHDMKMSLILFDLDDFKKVNDRKGHLYGDSVLRKVCETAQDQLRNADYLARFGGEEFAAILTHSDEGQAERIAERIRRAVENAFTQQEERVTVSLGCAEFRHEDRKEPDLLIFRADQALYRAKDLGKNRSVRFSCI